MGKKLRPKRIVEGWKNKLTGMTSETIEQRRKTCGECPLMKTGLINTCGVCGCEIEAKTSVYEEYCPKNKWEDIKFFSRGLVVRNLSPEMVSLSYDEATDYITVTYNNPIVKNEGYSENSKFVLQLINARGDFDISSSMVTLKNINVNGCGCFERKLSANTLREDESLSLEFVYNTNLDGDVSKTYRINTDQDVFTLKIKGTR
jgi:hypothetical protein